MGELFDVVSSRLALVDSQLFNGGISETNELYFGEFHRTYLLTQWIKHFQLLPYWQIFVSSSFVFYEFGLPILIILLSLPGIYQSVGDETKERLVWDDKTKEGNGRKVAVWICGLSTLLLGNLMQEFVIGTSYNENETPYFVVTCTVFWMMLRCVSFQLDRCPGNIWQFYAYCFHLPVLFSGPFLTFGDYESSLKKSAERPRLRLFRFARNFLRFTFWGLVMEFLLHFLYVNLVQYDEEVQFYHWIMQLE